MKTTDKAAQKHGWTSVPVSIAGLSESGGSAEHTGKSCSHPALVVRECGLMLYVDGIRAFAMGYHIFYESAESVSLPGAGRAGGENREPVYRDS